MELRKMRSSRSSMTVWPMPAGTSTPTLPEPPNDITNGDTEMHTDRLTPPSCCWKRRANSDLTTLKKLNSRWAIASCTS
eukprot:300325-Alexandrium_andersonii.AAC.1